jgi:hypothetical protein
MNTGTEERTKGVTYKGHCEFDDPIKICSVNL